jgi:hypothetical protein
VVCSTYVCQWFIRVLYVYVVMRYVRVSVVGMCFVVETRLDVCGTATVLVGVLGWGWGVCMCVPKT